MNNLLVSSREADLAYMEATNEIELFGDISYIDFFCEDGDTSIGSTIVNKIRSLVEKIQKFFTDLFSKITSSSLKSKADEAMKNDKTLAAKKVEVLDTKKIGTFSKKYKEKIKNAKSMDELDKIMAEYNTKKKIGFGVGAAVTVGLGVLCGKVLVPKYKEEQQKIIDNLNKEVEYAYEKYDAAIKECQDATNKADELEGKYAKYHKLTSAQTAKLRSAKIDAKIAKKIMEKTAQAVDYAIDARDHHVDLSKKELTQERLRCISMVISDEMNVVKKASMTKVDAIRSCLSGKVQAHKDAKAGKRAWKGVAQEATANGIITRSDGQVDVEATQNAAADYMDSADDADLAAFFGVSDIYA